MKKNVLFFIFLFMSIFVLSSCSDSDDSDTILSDEKKITEFSINGVMGTINEGSARIDILLPLDTDVKELIPIIKTSAKASVNPPSESAANFSSGSKDYTVTAENGSKQTYRVYVKVEEYQGIKYKVGDYYPTPDNPKTAIGIVFVGDNRGHGKIISLNEAQRLAWSTENVVTDCDNTDGAKNTTWIKNNKQLNKYPAFKWCLDKGEGWYMPSISELETIRKNMNVLNGRLQNVSGSMNLIKDGWYLSSNEYAEEYSHGVNFIESQTGSSYSVASKILTYDNLQKKPARTRAVLAF